MEQQSPFPDISVAMSNNFSAFSGKVRCSGWSVEAQHFIVAYMIKEDDVLSSFANNGYMVSRKKQCFTQIQNAFNSRFADQFKTIDQIRSKMKSLRHQAKCIACYRSPEDRLDNVPSYLVSLVQMLQRKTTTSPNNNSNFGYYNGIHKSLADEGIDGSDGYESYISLEQTTTPLPVCTNNSEPGMKIKIEEGELGVISQCLTPSDVILSKLTPASNPGEKNGPKSPSATVISSAVGALQVPATSWKEDFWPPSTSSNSSTNSNISSEIINIPDNCSKNTQNVEEKMQKNVQFQTHSSLLPLIKRKLRMEMEILELKKRKLILKNKKLEIEINEMSVNI